MKSSDFRIGNFVHDYNGQQSKIEAMDILAMNQCEVANTPIAFLSEIKLTGRWLIDFGFSKEGHDFVLHPGSIPTMRIYNPQDNLFVDDKTGTVFKTVHHLQNYFFALYLKELTIKESL